MYFIKPIKTNKPMENQPIQNQSTETYVNPLKAPANYDLTTLLNELKFGRPANDQLLLQKWIDELCEPKQTNKMETPLQNLKHYFRNDETITKRELERAIDELFDNERSFFIEAFSKGVASTGVISIGLNKGLEEYNSLYKTNNL